MSYAQNLDIQPVEASVAIGGRLIVAATATGKRCRVGAANTDRLLGVSERMGAEAGGICDVIMGGHTGVIAGGPLAFGDPITTDAQGRAVKAVPIANAVVFVVGFARTESVLGDIASILVSPSVIG